MKTNKIIDERISFLRFVMENYYQTYGICKQNVWLKRQEKAGTLIDPTEYTEQDLIETYEQNKINRLK